MRKAVMETLNFLGEKGCRAYRHYRNQRMLRREDESGRTFPRLSVLFPSLQRGSLGPIEALPSEIYMF